jgi:hypothetical protein
MAASELKFGVILMIPLDIHVLPIFCMAARETVLISGVFET